MQRLTMMLAMCGIFAASCTAVKTKQEITDPQRNPVKPLRVEIGEPHLLSAGIWSIAITVDVPTHEQEVVTTGDVNEVASKLLENYQRTFTTELQRALKALLERNAHCTISAISILHAKELWIGSTSSGGPMALPSGAIVVLPCGGNEPLTRPEAPAPPAPH
ncbi:hypothetical protein HY635_02310 [Candidatus Uhrbacteria bacterium]|nr:hypothetical protein [Candidatus Uhrbacteria bacterium]